MRMIKLGRRIAAVAAFAAAAALCGCAESPLCKAARRGDVAALQAASLAKDNAKKDALYCAVDSGHLEAVRTLLAAGAPISFMAMERARDHQPEILALLRQEQAKRDASKAAAAAAMPAQAPKEAPSDVDKPAYREAPRPADAALVIGVDGFAPHDADAVRAHLEALGYAHERVLSLTGAGATRLAALKALDAGLTPLAGGSRIVVYFSGRTAAGKDGQLYLLMSDSDPAYLEDTALPLERLYAKLASLKTAGARAVLLVLEAPAEAPLPKPPKGVSVLAAADASKTAQYDAMRHGAFTYFLLKTLPQAAGSARSALDAARPGVVEQAQKAGVSQTPALLGADVPLD